MHASLSPFNSRRSRETLAIGAFAVFLAAFVTALGVLIASGWWKLAVILVVSYVVMILTEVW